MFLNVQVSFQCASGSDESPPTHGFFGTVVVTAGHAFAGTFRASSNLACIATVAFGFASVGTDVPFVPEGSFTFFGYDLRLQPFPSLQELLGLFFLALSSAAQTPVTRTLLTISEPNPPECLCVSSTKFVELIASVLEPGYDILSLLSQRFPHRSMH
jgi:hypothetical protein